MPQLLLELFSEEIPARMQKRAEEDLARAFGEKLRAAGLDAKAIRTFSSPRRLGLVIADLPAKAADVNEEKKGPRVGSPDQAIQGFLKSAGLNSIDQAQIVEDKKGAFYVAKIERAGRATSAIVQEITPEIVRSFPWPKSMRSQSSDLQWVRPLHNVLCLFDGAPVKIEIEGVGSKPETWGHRFHAPAAIKPKDAKDHDAKLREAKVLIDREERKSIILDQAKKLCAAKNLELVEDAGLLEEVAGLVEWPVTLLGDMDPSFLNLPGEVIRLSMRTHQKYFAVRDPKTQKLAPHFITVANVDAKDGGKAIAAGNARVLSARLSDAQFFWKVDTATPLFTEERKEKLKKIVFHQKLGSVWDKVERVKALAEELCAVTGADKEDVKRAAELSKMDLVTETVGEFPELQGQVGRQLQLIDLKARLRKTSKPKIEDFTLEQLMAMAGRPQMRAGVGIDIPGESSIAQAIEDHYRPIGPNDRVPTSSVSATLAMADKLDTLVGFWAVDEKPTGSSDPYALRRAALGYIRIVLNAGLKFPMLGVLKQSTLAHIIHSPIDNYVGTAGRYDPPGEWGPSPAWSDAPMRTWINYDGFGDSEWERINSAQANNLGLDFDVDSEAIDANEASHAEIVRRLHALDFARAAADFDNLDDPTETKLDHSRVQAVQAELPGVYDFLDDLLAFLADRLKVQLRDQGKRHDLVDAVFALGDDDLVRIVARVEALDQFLRTEDGANLLAGYKRAANILAAEEKKGKGLTDADLKAGLDAKLLKEPAEQALYDALTKALPAARAAVEKEDFAAAMKALAGLRAPVDAFFEKVLVNADDSMLRRNRLLLLSRLREALSAVADFSKIEG